MSWSVLKTCFFSSLVFITSFQQIRWQRAILMGNSRCIHYKCCHPDCLSVTWQVCIQPFSPDILAPAQRERKSFTHFHLANMQHRVQRLIQGSRSVQVRASNQQPSNRTCSHTLHIFTNLVLLHWDVSALRHRGLDFKCLSHVNTKSSALWLWFCHEMSIFCCLYSIYLHFSFDYFQILIWKGHQNDGFLCVDGLKESKEWREDEKEWSQREREENSWRWKRSASQ